MGPRGRFGKGRIAKTYSLSGKMYKVARANIGDKTRTNADLYVLGGLLYIGYGAACIARAILWDARLR